MYDTDPKLVLTYTEDDTVELVEIAYSGDGGEEVFFDGVQLTYRFIDDVVADLAVKGYRGEPSDIGYRFRPGFAIFSMGSRSAQDLDPQAPRRTRAGSVRASRSRRTTTSPDRPRRRSWSTSVVRRQLAV